VIINSDSLKPKEEVMKLLKIVIITVLISLFSISVWSKEIKHDLKINLNYYGTGTKSFMEYLEPGDISSIKIKILKDTKKTGYFYKIRKEKVVEIPKMMHRASESTSEPFIEIVPFALSISNREVVKITIIYRTESGKDSRKWTFLYKEKSLEKQKNWFTHYGFSYPISSSQSDEGIYRIIENTDGDGYKIIETNNEYSSKLMPTIFYTWLPITSNSLNFGVTGGLGFDIKQPSLYLGISTTYKYNLMLTIGCVLNNSKKIKSYYKNILNTNGLLDYLIDKEELITDKITPRLFVSVSFRFGKSPFGKVK